MAAIIQGTRPAVRSDGTSHGVTTARGQPWEGPRETARVACDQPEQVDQADLDRLLTTQCLRPLPFPFFLFYLGSSEDSSHDRELGLLQRPGSVLLAPRGGISTCRVAAALITSAREPRAPTWVPSLASLRLGRPAATTSPCERRADGSFFPYRPHQPAAQPRAHVGRGRAQGRARARDAGLPDLGSEAHQHGAADHRDGRRMCARAGRDRTVLARHGA